ncbi:hypothetical protein VN12_15450 [Pirellula sp. SH-Sr6A]|uniref:hypothetical protein n=1 Tax=Pirellula sp. SH-Sr6A TaxID=1632865 RepID=UPI00078BEDDE|nr:hypothetical protein [Pirellula sp. SH-Sr6A]AMV33522.1 hypothetical protein VN12_15450 [Pirellula sp. SH-Sr6A]
MDSKRVIELPVSLLKQMSEYRQTVRRIKLGESIAAASLIVLVSYLAVFFLDRFLDTPFTLRFACWLMAVGGIAAFPWACYRWIVHLSTWESVARLLKRRQPALGDSLLGVLELAKNHQEQNRSPVLCQAALHQVAQSVAKRDLLVELPPSKHRALGGLAAVAVVLGAFVLATVPAAAWNAALRFSLPLAHIDRYTFTSLEEVPARLVVPIGEEFPLQLRLASESRWTPQEGRIRLQGQDPFSVGLDEGRYSFSVPAQLEKTSIQVAIGDASPSIDVEPAPRPELQSLVANIRLPSYLEIASPIEKDIRGGVISSVRGSTIQLLSKTNKPLSSAQANALPLPIRDGAFAIPDYVVSETTILELRWRDMDGLESRSAFPLLIQSVEDEPPFVFGDGLPKSKVVLDSEQIQFQVRAMDDFGVRRVGLVWKAIEEQLVAPENPVPSGSEMSGEVMLAKGGPTQSSLDAMAVFQAIAMNIPAKAIEVRLFAEDYHPERERAYSSPCVFYVLNPNDHAIWILDQVNRWQRESLEVRDCELQLLAINRQLRDLPESELGQEATRKRLEEQASAEQSNGRRLNNLTAKGDELLRQAARNAEIDPNQLETWAQMQQVLKDIASNRMPSVADLLKQSARANTTAGQESKETASNNTPTPQVGKTQNGDPAGESGADEEKQSTAPKLNDQETSQQPSGPEGEKGGKSSANSPAALRLPSTTLMGSQGDAQPEEEGQEATPVEQAVEEQEALLAEFEKVADALNNVMGNLEGSTLVKRLKAASREQLEIAEGTNRELSEAFGSTTARLTSEQRMRLEGLSQRELQASEYVATIVDDMQGFQERRPSPRMADVVEEMKAKDLLGNLQRLAQRMTAQQGLAIAEAEYWSDVLDRWAEDIVESAAKGEGQGGKKGKKSLPPALVLEVMQVLEQEMNLRDRTRVAEQSKEAATADDYRAMANELTQSQILLRERIASTRQKISELPDAQAEFERELGLLTQVDAVMQEAAGILSKPSTGREAVAAETEAIELLLQARRSSPQKSGGGGGTDPGGGGGGTTDEAAIALVGPGVNPNEQRQERNVSQETGSTGTGLPEEFRSGLDEYFQRLESKGPSR